MDWETAVVVHCSSTTFLSSSITMNLLPFGHCLQNNSFLLMSRSTRLVGANPIISLAYSVDSASWLASLADHLVPVLTSDRNLSINSFHVKAYRHDFELLKQWAGGKLPVLGIGIGSRCGDAGNSKTLTHLLINCCVYWMRDRVIFYTCNDHKCVQETFLE